MPPDALILRRPSRHVNTQSRVLSQAHPKAFTVKGLGAGPRICIAELWEAKATSRLVPAMQMDQSNRALIFRMRAEALVALTVISLLGCAATGPVARPPIEGPVRLGEIAAVDGPQVRPDSVIEDSHCPPGVQCIQAGRLIVRATVLGGGWSQQKDLTLGVPIPVADGMLTLVEAEATHVPIIGKAAASAARFTFKFEGGR